MAFAVAGIVAIITILFAMLQTVAARAGACPEEGDEIDPSGARESLALGLSIAVMIAASHWLAWPW
jgi:preprotein translocase subunit Sec61beta